MTIVVRTNEPVIETPKDTTQKGETASTTASDDQKSAPEATSEQNEESTESDTEDKETTEAKEETGDTESDGDAAKPEDTADKDDEKPKKKGGFQRRIDKLNAQKAAAQQEAEYWRNLATKSAGGEAKKEPIVETKTAKADAGAPDPEKFETHAEYVQALTDWKVEQKLNERDQKAAKSRIETEQRSKLKAHYERETSFSKKTEDYAEVMEDANYLKDVSPALQQLIVESDNGPELMYELAKNKAEYDRINGLPAIAAARELGKFESKLSKASTTESKQEIKTITNAPAPLAPVGSGKGSAKKSIFDPNLSQDEYERLRAEQMKRKGA